MHPNVFQTPLDPDTSPDLLRCDVCQWRCELAPSDCGRCGVRHNRNGVIENGAHAAVSAATIMPIEALRLWHFFPDAQTFTVGSFGTPFPAQQQEPYAMPPDGGTPRIISAERVVEVALQRLCRGVVWTYNDPVIGAEWLVDGLKQARAASRFAAITSGGYWTPEVMQAVGPYLDGLRLDLLGIGDRPYAELGGIGKWRGIFTAAERLRKTWNVHIEVMLRLHPGINDDDEQIATLATWIRRALGDLTPLHLLPASDDETTSAQTLHIARASGLRFVYGSEPDQPTHCPGCNTVVIRRTNELVEVSDVLDGECASCGTPLGLRSSIFQRQTVYSLPEMEHAP